MIQSYAVGARAKDPISGLTPKQKRFCEEYLKNNGNATQACIAAGYSEQTAYRASHTLIKKPHIIEYLRPKIQKVEQQLELTFERKIAKLVRLVNLGIPDDDSSSVNPKMASLAIAALNEINKMQGHYSPEKRVNINLNADTDIQKANETLKKLTDQHTREY